MTQDLLLHSAKVSSVPQPEEGFGEKYARLITHFEANPVAIDEPFRGDPMVVLSNVNRGLLALRPHLATLRTDTSVAWDDVMASDDVAEALVFACDQVVDVKVTRDQIDEVRRNLQKLREPGLLIARGLALLGDLPMERVEQLEAGTGILDTGRDGIGLAALLREFAPKIAGMHPFHEQRLQTMESLGAWILRHVTPDGAVARKPTEPTAAALRRDMLWAELRKRHGAMRLGGFKIYGEGYNANVPPLGSRIVTRKAAGATDDDPAPAPPPADPIRPPT